MLTIKSLIDYLLVEIPERHRVGEMTEIELSPDELIITVRTGSGLVTYVLDVGEDE